MLSPEVEEIHINAFCSANINKIRENSITGALDLYIGNEACDLDSFVCSLVLAKLSNENFKEANHIPVLNCRREDLRLKKEIIKICELLNLSTDNLVFLDDIENLDTSRLKIHLVDHNQLSQQQSGWANYVVEIVDHHSDTKSPYFALTPESKQLRIAGSCASLLAGRLKDNDKQSALLLLGAILIDTNNLSHSVQEVDLNAIQRIEQILRISDQQKNDLFKILFEARNDFSGLSLEDLLGRDQKRYSSIAISTLPSQLRLKDYSIQALTDACEAKCRLQNLEAILVLTVSGEHPNTKREITIHAISRDKHQEVLQRLSSNFSFAINLETEKTTQITLDEFKTRKQIAPLFE